MKEFNFEKLPIVEIANEIIIDAVNKGASDIHFDPSKEALKIRFRIGMNIMETRLPQDGAI